eukprot:1581389-Amphidinium_carterae.1
MACFCVHQFCDYGIQHKRTEDESSEDETYLFTFEAYTTPSKQKEGCHDLKCLIFQTGCTTCQSKAETLRNENDQSGREWQSLDCDFSFYARDKWEVQVSAGGKCTHCALAMKYGPQLLPLFGLPSASEVWLRGQRADG